MASPTWTEIAPGIWKYTLGKPAFTPLGVTGAQPNADALAHLPPVEIPLSADAIAVETRPGATVFRLPLNPREQLYGLGLQFKKINQRTGVFHLKVDHYGGKDTGRTHAPIPFYVSSDGYGILVNTASDPTFYLGSANRKDGPNPPLPRDRTTDPLWSAQPVSDAVEIFVPETDAEIFIFGGPTPLDAVRRYNLFCGGGCLPPRWGLGFWHRIPTPYSDRQAIAEVDEFARRDFPLHVLGLEPGWQSRAYPCSYEWSEDRFPDPSGFLKKMADKQIRINLWENPYISPDAPLYSRLYALSGSHTVWCGIVPDYTLPEAQTILADQHAQTHLAIGVSGYKIDECDGYDRWLWPGHAIFPSGRTGMQMRQTYGVQLQQLTTRMFRKHKARTFGLVRASHAGAQSLPYVLYSDSYDHRDYVTALCNSGFSGILWCPEVRIAHSAEEWIRRFQTAVFSPLMQLNAWSDGTKPWSYPEIEGVIRDQIRLRIRLSPYLYSAFARYRRDGTPPFRAMALDASPETLPQHLSGQVDATKNPYALPKSTDTRDQYMMGDCLLVAPVFAGQTERQIILPPGNWYDFYSGEYAGNGETITVTARLETIPVFVKDGGILPLLPEDADLDQIPTRLDIRHYGRSGGQFLLHSDDGETWGYETGDYTLQELRVTPSRNGLLGDTVRHSGKADWLCENLSWRFMCP